MSTQFYLLGLNKILTQSIDWSGDTIKAMLCTSAYTPNYTTNEFASTPAASALSGYVRPTLTCSFNTNTGSDRIELIANDVTISAVTTGQTIASVVVYKDTGNDATSPLIGVTTGLSQATNGGDITIDFNASGYLAINRNV
jgi:hypothetical protein